MSIDDARIAARTGTQTIVHRVLRDLHGADSVTERPAWEGASTALNAPLDYKQGIQAARMVAGAANNLVTDYARAARAEGTSWKDLAEPLGVADLDDDEDPAVAAFKLVAWRPSMPFDPVTTSWKCASCGKYVTDLGPYNGHPVDDEQGHAEDCARHLAAIQAYEARWNDE